MAFLGSRCTYLRIETASVRRSSLCTSPSLDHRTHLTRHDTVCPQPRAVSSTSAESLRPPIWTGSSFQQQAFHSLKTRLQKQRIDFDDATIQWFLRDRYFDVNEAEMKLATMHQWRRSFLGNTTVTKEQVAAELATGKAYIHTHLDVENRPAVVVRARHHVTGQFALSDSKRLCVYLLQEAMCKFPPGQEQFVGIFDLRGFGVRNADVLFAKFMIEAFFVYYPRRTAKVLLVDAPWIFNTLYLTLKPLLRKYAALVEFVPREEVRSRYFRHHTAPPDFV